MKNSLFGSGLDDMRQKIAKVWHSINKLVLVAGVLLLTIVSSLCFHNIFWYILLLIEVLAVIIFSIYITYNDEADDGDGDDDDENIKTLEFDKLKDGFEFIPVEENGILFKDLTLKDPVRELKTLVDYIKNPDIFEKEGYYPESRILFVGCKGSGKSTIIKAFSNETNFPIIRVHASRFFQDGNLFESIFEPAKYLEACILQIDFFENFFSSKSSNASMPSEIIIDKLLQCLDVYHNVILFATCEECEDFNDNAISRCFKKIIAIAPPDFKERIELLEYFTSNSRLDSSVDFSSISKTYIGASIGEIKYYVNIAKNLAHNNKRNYLTQEDFFNALDTVESGISSKKHSKYSQKLVAYHEAGHAIVEYVLSGNESILRVISTSRGDAGGYTLSSINEENVVTTYEELFNRICMYYGGRCAEKIIFNHLSTGATVDIQMATSTILNMVQRYGMSEEIGPINVSPKLAFFSVINESDDMRNLISKECSRIAKMCEEKTMSILNEHRGELDTLANYLIEHESITGTELKELLNNSK